MPYGYKTWDAGADVRLCWLSAVSLYIKMRQRADAAYIESKLEIQDVDSKLSLFEYKCALLYVDQHPY